jgi:hypothetical protein
LSIKDLEITLIRYLLLIHLYSVKYNSTPNFYVPTRACSNTARKLIFGPTGIAAFDGQTINEILALLDKHNVEKIDTANAYVSYPHPIILFGIV